MSPKSRIRPVKPQWEGGVFRQISRPSDDLKSYLHIHFTKFTEIFNTLVSFACLRSFFGNFNLILV